MHVMDESLPYIEFFEDKEEDRTASEEAGHIIYRMIDRIKVIPQGGKHEFIGKAVDWIANKEQDAKNKRVSNQYVRELKLMYAEWKEGNEIPLKGTPIKGWPVLTEAMQLNVINANIRTVEDLAQATEEGLTNIGMGARDLKRKALAWIESSEDKGKVAMRVASLEQENDELKARIVTLEGQLKDKPKRGRPAKEAA